MPLPEVTPDPPFPLLTTCCVIPLHTEDAFTQHDTPQEVDILHFGLSESPIKYFVKLDI